MNAALIIKISYFIAVIIALFWTFKVTLKSNNAILEFVLIVIFKIIPILACTIALLNLMTFI